MKRSTVSFFAGIITGAVLFGGSAAYAAGIMAELSSQPIYVDGQRVQMTAYNIAGNNYVKLRDVGQALGINVYWQNGVQIDSFSPYTGEAPTTSVVSSGEIRVNCSHGNTIPAGERRGLIISPSGTDYKVSSSDPSIVDIESVLGLWAAIAKAPGTAALTVTAPDGRMGRVVVTVSVAIPDPERTQDIDLSANMEIRDEIIRLINQTRKANGASELAANAALMDAAQDCSAQGFTGHENQYECETGLAYGYPYGFGSNFTIFTTRESAAEIAQHAVNNWINSPGHFQTMIDPRGNCIGVGVTVNSGIATCFLFVGDPSSHNPYE